MRRLPRCRCRPCPARHRSCRSRTRRSGRSRSPPRVPASPADADAGFAPFDLDIGAPIEYPRPHPRSRRCTRRLPWTDRRPMHRSYPISSWSSLPELGAPLGDGMAPTVTVLEESVDETIDVGAAGRLARRVEAVLRVVADNTAAHGGPPEPRARSATRPGADAADRRAAHPESPPAIEPEEVTVGPVTLSAALWRILCDEADQNVAVLQHEVSILQFDPDHMPVVAMVRASHTLCGIHRTGGIALIATTARSLEQALLALEERGAPFPSTAQPILARATAGLAHFVERVKNREGFTPSDEREASDIEHRARGNAPRCTGRHAGRRSADPAGERARVRHAARRGSDDPTPGACRRSRRSGRFRLQSRKSRARIHHLPRQSPSPAPARCC